MLSQLISSAFRNRLLVILLTILGVGLGLLSYARLSTDVFPDLTVPVFNVITQNASMAPEELELSVTLPVESALNGLPSVRRIRSTTQLGVSQVTVEFDSEWITGGHDSSCRNGSRRCSRSYRQARRHPSSRA
jgi:heavy metal efflux system protein